MAEVIGRRRRRGALSRARRRSRGSRRGRRAEAGALRARRAEALEERLQTGEHAAVVRDSSGSDPWVTSTRRPRATRVAAGERPTKENRLHRSPCSTDSSRKPGPSPTMARNAPTGVRLSAISSRQTGTTEWLRHSSQTKPGQGRPARSRRASRPSGQRPGGGHAGRRRSWRWKQLQSPVWQAPAALLVDGDQQCVAVAVIGRRPHPLAVAGGLALAPVLLPAPAPEPGASGGEGTPQRLRVHPAEHQDVFGLPVLHDSCHETPVVKTHLGELLVGEPNGRGRSQVEPRAVLEPLGGDRVRSRSRRIT